MAHTIDTSAQFPTTATSTSTADPVSTTYTCGAGTTVLCLMIIYAGGTDRAGGAPTYNGSTLSQADSVRRGSTGPECSAELWYLLNPTTGSSLTLNVPNSGALATKLYIASAKAASGKTSALDVANGAGTVGTNPSATVVTTVNGDAIFAVVADGAQAWNSSAVTGTEIGEGDLGAWGGGSQYLMQTSAGSQAMTFTFATSEDYGVVVAAFKEVTPPSNTGAFFSLFQ